MFSVGFFSTNSLTAYAYDKEDNFYPVTSNESVINVYLNALDWNNRQVYMGTVRDNSHYFANPYLENVVAMSWEAHPDENYFSFPYNPEVYDYYFLGTMYSSNDRQYDKSTFKPTRLEVYGEDYATQGAEYYPLSGLGFYDIDSQYYSGFGWYTKIDFQSRENIGLTYINFLDDKDGKGNKPANLILDMGVLAVEKSSSQDAVMAQILAQLNKMESSITENIQNGANAITGAIGESAEKIQSAIENQFNMDDSEDFGVNEITGQVEEKLGVLNFTADTLTNFLDLFNAYVPAKGVLYSSSFTAYVPID